MIPDLPMAYDTIEVAWSAQYVYTSGAIETTGKSSTTTIVLPVSAAAAN